MSKHLSLWYWWTYAKETLKPFNTIVIQLGAFLSCSIISAAHHSAVEVFAAGYGAAWNPTERRNRRVIISQTMPILKGLSSYPENWSVGSGHPPERHKKWGEMSGSFTLVSNSLGVVGRPGGGVSRKICFYHRRAAVWVVVIRHGFSLFITLSDTDTKASLSVSHFSIYSPKSASEKVGSTIISVPFLVKESAQWDTDTPKREGVLVPLKDWLTLQGRALLLQSRSTQGCQKAAPGKCGASSLGRLPAKLEQIDSGNQLE